MIDVKEQGKLRMWRFLQTKETLNRKIIYYNITIFNLSESEATVPMKL